VEESREVKAMRIGWLVLVSMLVLSSVVVSAENGGSTLSFRLYGGYTVVVKGSIGGLAKLNFIVDTGAVPTVVDKRIARKLRLEGNTEELQVFSGTLQTERVVVPSVVIGPIQTGPHSVLVEDLSPFSLSLGISIDGMVGLDILGQSNFTLDYFSKQIIFGALGPSDPASTVPIEVNPAGYVTVEAAIDGRLLRLMVDTGTSDFVLFRNRVRDSVRGVRLLSRKPMANLGGRLQVVTAELDEAALGPLSLRGRHVSLMDVSPATPPDLEGLLGARYLGSDCIAFDFEHKRMAWESGAEAAGKASSERPGWVVGSSFAFAARDSRRLGR